MIGSNGLNIGQKESSAVPTRSKYLHVPTVVIDKQTRCKSYVSSVTVYTQVRVYTCCYSASAGRFLPILQLFKK